jgi:hypothetical protein
MKFIISYQVAGKQRRARSSIKQFPHVYPVMPICNFDALKVFAARYLARRSYTIKSVTKWVEESIYSKTSKKPVFLACKWVGHHEQILLKPNAVKGFKLL